MRREWIKLFCNQWLRGSIRKEAIEVRAVFADLLTMAGDSAFGDDGVIQLADGIGFTDEMISGMLNVPLKTWRSAKERLADHPDPDENRIEIFALSQGFGIRILNWTRYQSEYQRQKQYRHAPLKKSQPPLSSVSSLSSKREGEGEREGEQFVTKVTRKVTRCPASSPEEIKKEFDDFWEAYPEGDRGDRDQAFDAYQMLRAEESVEKIERALEGYLSELKNKRIHEKFDQATMYASRFLRGDWKRFLDSKYKPSM